MKNTKKQMTNFTLRIPISLRDELVKAGAKINLRPTAYASLILALAMQNEPKFEKIILPRD